MYIITGAVVATSLMTLFSYTLSALTKEQFREPELLNFLLTRSALIPVKVARKSWAGWVIHYLVGTLFIIVFDLIWNMKILEPTILSGAYLGFLAGIIGITGWKVFFLLSPDPPKIDFKRFYLQLLVGHVIFGLGAAAVKILLF